MSDTKRSLPRSGGSRPSSRTPPSPKLRHRRQYARRHRTTCRRPHDRAFSGRCRSSARRRHRSLRRTICHGPVCSRATRPVATSRRRWFHRIGECDTVGNQVVVDKHSNVVPHLILVIEHISPNCRMNPEVGVERRAYRVTLDVSSRAIDMSLDCLCERHSSHDSRVFDVRAAIRSPITTPTAPSQPNHSSRSSRISTATTAAVTGSARVKVTAVLVLITLNPQP